MWVWSRGGGTGAKALCCSRPSHSEHDKHAMRSTRTVPVSVLAQLRKHQQKTHLVYESKHPAPRTAAHAYTFASHMYSLLWLPKLRQLVGRHHIVPAGIQARQLLLYRHPDEVKPPHQPQVGDEKQRHPAHCHQNPNDLCCQQAPITSEKGAPPTSGCRCSRFAHRSSASSRAQQRRRRRWQM